MTPAQVAHIMSLVDELKQAAYAGKTFSMILSIQRDIEAALLAPQAEPPRKWADAVQSFADELELPFLEAKSFLDEVFPQWMADKEAAGFVTLRLDDLIEGDSYGVDGSDFYRCRICHAESGAGMLNNGIKHEHDCPLAARPLTASPTAPSTEHKPLFGEMIAQHPGLREEIAAELVEQDERAAFEAAYRARYPLSCDLDPAKFNRSGEGDYEDIRVSIAWAMWQASAGRASGVAK